MEDKVDILINDWYINSRNYLNSKKNLKNDEPNKIINEYLIEQILELDIKRLIVYLDSNRLNDKVRVIISDKKINPLTTHRYDVLSKHLRSLIREEDKTELLELLLRLFSIPSIKILFDNYINGRYPNTPKLKLYGSLPVDLIEDVNNKELQDVYRIATIIHLIINKITGNNKVQYKTDLNIEVKNKSVRLSIKRDVLEITVLKDLTVYKYTNLDNKFKGIIDNLQLDNSYNLSKGKVSLEDLKTSLDYLKKYKVKETDKTNYINNIKDEEYNIKVLDNIIPYIPILKSYHKRIIKFVNREMIKFLELKRLFNERETELILNKLENTILEISKCGDVKGLKYSQYLLKDRKR